MKHRHQLIVICVLFAICFLVNMIVYVNTLWTIYLIPMMLLIIRMPSKRIAAVGMSILTISRLIRECYYEENTNAIFYSTFTTIVISWFIIILFTYFVINNHRIKNELQELINIDPLTKLYNRRYLDQFKNDTIHDHSPLSIIILDIDHFKNINDEYGHQFGDRVLKKLATTLQYNLRETDSAVRIGGEEFMLILPHTEIDSAISIAERLRAVVANKSITFGEGVRVSITISLGVSTLNKVDTFSTLYMKADNALYDSKRNGRNQVTVIN